jgi:hypothetical protein
MKKKKRNGYFQIYKRYPYKVMTTEKDWWHVGKKEHTEHQYSLTFTEWKEFAREIVSKFVDDLFNGETVVLPFSLGTVRIKKYRRKPKFSYVKENREKIRYERMVNSEGYGLLIDWRKKNRFVGEFYKLTIAKGLFLKKVDELESFHKFSG